MSSVRGLGDERLKGVGDLFGKEIDENLPFDKIYTLLGLHAACYKPFFSMSVENAQNIHQVFVSCSK